MLITRIEEGKSKRYRVFGEERFLFALYGRELKQYHIEEGAELTDNVHGEILQQIVYKRAKERALYLLEKHSFTVNMLRDKLHVNEYPIDVIEQVIVFLQKYHYLNDKEYTRLYVNSHSDKKSKKQIISELLKKGVSKDIIEIVFEENEYSEQQCFSKQFARYTRGKNLEDYITRQKVFRYFYNKGFSSALIESYIRESGT